jgi:hypothetical protein
MTGAARLGPSLPSRDSCKLLGMARIVIPLVALLLSAGAYFAFFFKTAEDDFTRFCARLQDLETGGPLGREFDHGPGARLDHLAIAAALTEEDAATTEAHRDLFNAVANAAYQDAPGLLETGAREANRTFDCPAFKGWFEWRSGFGEDGFGRLALLGDFCSRFKSSPQLSPEHRFMMSWMRFQNEAQPLGVALPEFEQVEPSAVLAVLDQIARDLGVRFSCPDLKAWTARAALAP